MKHFCPVEYFNQYGKFNLQNLIFPFSSSLYNQNHRKQTQNRQRYKKVELSLSYNFRRF